MIGREFTRPVRHGDGWVVYIYLPGEDAPRQSNVFETREAANTWRYEEARRDAV